MTTTGPFTAYLDVPTFHEMPNGADYDDMCTGNALLTIANIVGDTVLTVGTLATTFAPGYAYLFDGSFSEVVTISAVGSTTLTLSTPLVNSHAVGANVAQGPMDTGLPQSNSLPNAIWVASGWIENYTQRVLALATHTLENSPLLIDKDGFLIVKVYEWPVQSFTSIRVVMANGKTFDTMDPTQMQPEKGERLWTYTGPAGQYCPGFPYNLRSQRGWVQATYVAGHNPMKRGVVEACHLRTLSTVNRRDNYLGASAVQIDHTRIEQRLRGDDGFDDMFVAAAKENLNSYVRRD